MTQPYENQYIGVFIYSLGYKTALTKPYKGNLAAVDLLQQTPSDPTFADLLFHDATRGFVIEFKRDSKGVDQEFYKETKKELFWRLREDKNVGLRLIAQKCHFIGYGVQKAKSEDIHFVPYILTESQEWRDRTTDLDGFLDSYLDEESQEIGVPIEDFKTYLEFLASTEANGTSGMIVTTSRGGKVKCMSVPDIGNLGLKISVAKEIIRSINMPSLSKKGRGI